MSMMACLAILGVVGAAGRPAAPRPPVLDQSTPRIVSRGSTLVLKVVDYDQARRSVLGAAQNEGAELLTSRTEVDYQGKQHGWMRFQVEGGRLPTLQRAARAVGKLYAERTNTEDRTSEYEELERRIERLREHQPRLASLLQSSRRLRGSDILFVQDRLFRAGVDEGSLRQRRADLERSAKVASLVVELFEAEPRRAMNLGNYYAGSALRARVALYREMARALTVGAYALAFAPLWIPALLVCVLLARWLWRRSRSIAARLAPLGALLLGAIARRLPVTPRPAGPPDAAAGSG